MSTQPTLRNSNQVHAKAVHFLHGIGMAIAAGAATDKTGARTLAWATGAPDHTAAQGSVYIRVDAADSDSVFYRNTDGAATWETIVGSEVTELLAADNAWTGTNSFGVDGTGVDVIFYGDTAARRVTWDFSADALRADDNTTMGWGSGAGTTPDIGVSWNGTKLLIAQLTTNSAIDFGVSGAGIDVVHYGDTVGADKTWDQSADSEIFGDNAKLVLGTGSDVAQYWDAAKLVTIPAVDDSLWEIGDGTLNLDVTIYGATAAAHTKWDASANTVTFTGFVPTFASGFVSNSTQDQNAIIDQDTADTTGTGDAFNSRGTSTSATGSYGIINGTFEQLTNAKTAGVGFGVQGTYVGLAGDTSGAIVGGLYAAAPTLNGGSATDCGLAIAAGWTNDIYFADVSAVMTFQDGQATAFTLQDSSGNDFLLIDSVAADGMTFGNATTNPVYTFLGTGGVNVSAGTLTVGAANVSGAMQLLDGASLALQGQGTGTGDVVEYIGPTSADGWQTVVYQQDISPSAVETNSINLPAGIQLQSVQARCTAILTGGGTTVTWSIGTAADPDHYGSAGFSSIAGSAAADSLAANSNVDWYGDSAHAMSLSSAAEQLVLTGCATGGTADGDTALTVGTVRVRVIYKRLQPLTPV